MDMLAHATRPATCAPTWCVRVDVPCRHSAITYDTRDEVARWRVIRSLAHRRRSRCELIESGSDRIGSGSDRIGRRLLTHRQAGGRGQLLGCCLRQPQRTTFRFDGVRAEDRRRGRGCGEGPDARSQGRSCLEQARRGLRRQLPGCGARGVQHIGGLTGLGGARYVAEVWAALHCVVAQ